MLFPNFSSSWRAILRLTPQERSTLRHCSRVYLHPQVQFSLHTNYCDLGFCLAEDGRRLVLISCLDNLLKGAALNAVQIAELVLSDAS